MKDRHPDLEMFSSSIHLNFRMRKGLLYHFNWEYWFRSACTVQQSDRDHLCSSIYSIVFNDSVIGQQRL